MWSKLSFAIFKLIGWKTYYEPLPGPHGIIVVYPHTSNWDFPLGVLWKSAYKVRPRWVAKESLFKPPVFGWFMRKLGGIGIKREGNLDVAQNLKKTMLAEDNCWLVIAIEGTRSYKPYIHLGYYYIAKAANVAETVEDKAAEVKAGAQNLLDKAETEADVVAVESQGFFAGLVAEAKDGWAALKDKAEDLSDDAKAALASTADKAEDLTDAAKAKATLSFFDWVYNSGDDAASKLDYVPLPADVKALVRESWKQVVDAEGKPVL